VIIMAKKTGPTNPYLKELVEKLKKKSLELNAPIWKDVASKLGSSTRRRIEVNLSKIDRYANDGDTILVPGVVLASGKLSKKLNVAAWRFSPASINKIKEKGKVLTIEDLLQENPRGSNVRIMA
jgi:large subunit ribosomal protein L18e